jgi:hypothetical protein
VGKMKFVEVIVILTIALTVVWSAGDNQDEDDDQDHSIWPTHEFIVKKTQWKSGPKKGQEKVSVTLEVGLYLYRKKREAKVDSGLMSSICDMPSICDSSMMRSSASKYNE